jgi:hypothetical protein
MAAKTPSETDSFGTAGGEPDPSLPSTDTLHPTYPLADIVHSPRADIVHSPRADIVHSPGPAGGESPKLTTAQSLFREGDKDKNGILDYAPVLVRGALPVALLLGLLVLLGGGLFLLPKLNLFSGPPPSGGLSSPAAPTATTQAAPTATVTSVAEPTSTPVPQPTTTPVPPPPPHLSVTPTQANAFCLNNQYPAITVTNTGQQTLNWSASGPTSPAVVTPSPASGSLGPGQMQTVSVSGSSPGPSVSIQFSGNGGSATVTYTCH